MILTDRNGSDRHRREKMLREKKEETQNQKHTKQPSTRSFSPLYSPMSVWIHIYLNKCTADGQKEHALNTPEWVSVGDGTLRSGEERRQN